MVDKDNSYIQHVKDLDFISALQFLIVNFILFWVFILTNYAQFSFCIAENSHLKI